MEKDIQPVGQDYIEEIRSEDNKIVSFNCKLCECRFNDPNAKEMHMKGRRHRLQYKKKVNPDLIVDVKPSSRQKKIEDRRANRGTAAGRRAQVPSEAFPRGPPVPLLPPGCPRGFGPGGPTAYHSPPAPLFYIPPLMRRNDTPEDLYVMSKHSEIVSSTEKALKFVSDQFADTDAKKANGVANEDATKWDGSQGWRHIRLQQSGKNASGQPHYPSLFGFEMNEMMAESVLSTAQSDLKESVIAGLNFESSR